MPCPHNEITIVQRSQRQSAVAAAAYQSGEKLFCEYDQQVKHYPEKRGIVHNEILLPANAPRSYADRNTLWNAAEAVEKQWNSQLARRWVLTIPREIPPDQYAVLVREFCEQQFVSKGMIADFAIHDPHPPGHNPHAHVLLTMRAMDEHGKWLPKSRKVYDLDENGERIKLPSGRWKSHKEDTVDWNDQKYESTHDYDEYHFDLDDIEHDPYVLISMISALHEGAWTVDEVQGTLQNLFDRQYILTEEVEVEVRYRTETDTWTDEEGNTHTDTYQVPYDYYICYVTLENFNLSHVPIYMMSEEQLSRYALYMATLGNRPDLFPQSGYVPRYTNPPPKHDVPEAYLADETFAAILEEAEKYLGFPYVWGGSSPSTSFDCSGFVSYVYNQCGWDFGRLGAQGLYNISTPTNNPKPGDLVFFTGTYDTPGVSHVGIYVGDGWMLDCGDPIHYSNLNTNYWQSHFYAYGKLY